MFFLIPIALFMFGLLVHCATRLIYGVRGAAADDTLHLLLRLLGWGLIVAGGAFWLMLSLGALPIAIMLGVLAGFAVVDAVLAARDSNRRNNSKLLAIAIREHQLSDALQLFSETDAGWFVDQATQHLAYDLKNGTPLYESVVASPAALPRGAIAYAAIGSLAGAEAEALDQLGAPANAQLAAAWRWWSDQLAYAVALILTFGTLLSLFCLFILPQFVDIFWEFNLELPTATQAVVNMSDVRWVWALCTFGMLCGLLAMFVVGVFYLLDAPVLRLATDWVFRKIHSADALRLLALAIEHRAELPRAVYALSVTHPVRAIRTRLSASYQDISHGQPWAEVLMHNGLLSRNEQGLVDTAATVGNLPWALRQIANRRESTFVARLTTLGHLLYPIMLCAIGGFVGLVVIALFMPLVKLVEGLS